MKKFHVTFQPAGRRGEIAAGKTIIEASRELGVELESSCGGRRSCGKCRVRIAKGNLAAAGPPPPSEPLSPFQEGEGKFIGAEERAAGDRLACAAQIRGDVAIFVPEESRGGRQVVRKGAAEKSFALKPAVVLHLVSLAAPTFQDPRGDFERLKSVLVQTHNLPATLTIDYHALRRLPAALREGKWQVTVATWMEKEIIAVEPGMAESGVYVLAVDIGTTSVAAYLCHLPSGRLIATETMMNPQVAYGEDVMSRISYGMTHPEGLETLHRSLIEGLNRLLETLTAKCGISSQAILEMAMVGNPAMHHLFLGIRPDYLGLSPFPPAIHQAVNIKARDLGLQIHPGANVHCLPLEAGFVGADTVGVLIAERPHRQQQMALIIDVGTNGELVLGNREKLLATSCATGPALEGAHITFGLRAAPGAIEGIRIDRETWEVSFKVIGRETWSRDATGPAAKGICGSGIIDGVAELFRTGAIDNRGRFASNLPSPRFRINGGSPEFVIAWQRETALEKDITITQGDVRNVQLAKAALYTGAKLMMRRLGITQVDKVVLAGAFGSYINPRSALILGMFPDCDLKKVSAVGNAAGDGARIALLNRDRRREAERIAARVEYLELTVEPDFQQEFMDAMYLPHKKDLFPHLGGILGRDIPSRK